MLPSCPAPSGGKVSALGVKVPGGLPQVSLSSLTPAHPPPPQSCSHDVHSSHTLEASLALGSWVLPSPPGNCPALGNGLYFGFYFICMKSKPHFHVRFIYRADISHTSVVPYLVPCMATHFQYVRKQNTKSIKKKKTELHIYSSSGAKIHFWLLKN